MFARSIAILQGRKVTVLGAAGGIGQPLSLLLKNQQGISNLSLYDVMPVVKGVAVDLSHLPKKPEVQGYCSDKELPEALNGSDIVVMCAGVPRKPSMTRDDLFKINAGINFNLAKQIAITCPSAMILVVANPVNSLVPLVAEVLKREMKGASFDPRKLLGVTTLDILRGNTFVSQELAKKGITNDVEIDVVGGHSGCTIVPILSPYATHLGSALPNITKRIQYGGDEVVQAKQGAGSATLSMAYAAARLVEKVLRGGSSKEQGEVSECAYILNSSFDKRVSYFSSRVSFGPHGVSSVPAIDLESFSTEEKQNIEVCIKELRENIQKGENYTHEKYLA
ncbi:NAD-malate dehydrogenase [Perkinsela sp. CCAP 1560/4]|nr:NAD-malate dehydrogenase [Perkinsela sp. CCAP 1560/4]|eukprot:KNH06982.1 NAD-malate dehydrogenase [Perkinsela sp. CCAP 1560/4]